MLFWRGGTLSKLRKMFGRNKRHQEILTISAGIHRANIQKRLQQRLEVAKAKGDDNLVRLLEAEAKYFN